MTAFRRTLTTTSDLADAGLITDARAAQIAPVGARYAVAITPAMAELIDTGDADDPIARQFVPDIARAGPRSVRRRRSDRRRSEKPRARHRAPLPRPRAAEAGQRLPGLLPLLLPPRDGRPRQERRAVGSRSGGGTRLRRAHPEIWEVILTGGDPLILSPRRIAEVTRALGDIPHVKILRWHSRVPSVAPERVTRAAGRGPALIVEDGLCRAACQPSARADGCRARRLQAADRCRHRHGQPERAAERHQ